MAIDILNEGAGIFEKDDYSQQVPIIHSLVTIYSDDIIPPHNLQLDMDLIHEADEYKLAILKITYVWKNENEIQSFLEEYPFLVEFLFTASPYIAEYFGINTQWVLHLFSSSYDDTMLFVDIFTSKMDAEQAVNQFYKFQEDWFLDASHKTQGKLNFDVKIMTDIRHL